MGIMKKGYFLIILDNDKRLLALYSNECLLCSECAQKVGHDSWKPDKKFILRWLKPQLDGLLENSYAWCDKCGKTLWDNNENPLLKDIDDDTKIDGWRDELDEGDEEWFDELVQDSEATIIMNFTPKRKPE